MNPELSKPGGGSSKFIRVLTLKSELDSICDVGSTVIFISQMRKLKPLRLQNLPMVGHLVNSRAGTQTQVW